jgi:3-hydroxyisobutyrate dehydrogenase
VTTIAFLGLGTMGMPMARNLVKAGFTLRGWNRTLERAQALAEDGAEIFTDPREAAEGADLVVTMLTDSSAVLDTAGRALDGVPDRVVWAQMSTIGIDGTERCAELADRAAVPFVDAPVLGTRQPAERGELVILASGPEDAISECAPMFDAVGSRTLALGPAGAGTRLKVVVNSWIVGLVAVLAETISLAEALDVDPQRFFDAIEGTALDLPYAHMKGREMIEKDFSDAAFKLSLSRKDADLVLAAAEQSELEVPVMRAVADRLHRAEREGHGDEDMAATYWATAPKRGASRGNGRG